MAMSGPIKITPAEPVIVDNGDPGGWGGSGWGGGGGGGYSATPAATPADEINAQLENAADMYRRDVETANQGTQDSLLNILNQREANAQQLLMKRNQLARNSEWQPNQQKEQSTLSNLRKTMGNAAYGSGMVDLQEGMSRYDDMADLALINSFKENADNAYNSWYQADADLINDYNEQVIRAKNTLDTAYNTYLSNIAGIDAQLARQAYEQQGREISRTEDDQTYKTNVLAKDNSIEDWLKLKKSRASRDNPLIPNSRVANPDPSLDSTYEWLRKSQGDDFNPNTPNQNNIIDYVRPNNAVGAVNAMSNRGNVNTAAGAYRPSYRSAVRGNIYPRNVRFPGYNYQRENFAGYNIQR